MINFPVVKLPKYFSFHEAIKIIQRGSIDPCNIIDNKILIKAVTLRNEEFLIKLYEEESFLKIDIIENKICTNNFKNLSALIIKFIGLDDPLFLNKTNFITNYKYPITFSFGVHGYISLFEASIQTILGQLVSGNIANIARKNFIIRFSKFIGYRGNKYYLFPSAEYIEKLSLNEIMSIGITRVKSQAILNIAKEFVYNNLEYRLINMDNSAQIRNTLMCLYGIGRWTSDWISLKALRKFDVIPSGDLIIRKAFSWWRGLDEIASSTDIDLFCNNWGPYKGALMYNIMLNYNIYKNN